MPLTLHAIHAIEPGRPVLVGDLQFLRTENRRPRLAVRVWLPWDHRHEVFPLPDTHAIDAVAEADIADPTVEGGVRRVFVAVDPARLRENGRTLDHFRSRLRSYLAEMRHAGRLADRPVI